MRPLALVPQTCLSHVRWINRAYLNNSGVFSFYTDHSNFADFFNSESSGNAIFPNPLMSRRKSPIGFRNFFTSVILFGLGHWLIAFTLPVPGLIRCFNILNYKSQQLLTNAQLSWHTVAFSSFNASSISCLMFTSCFLYVLSGARRAPINSNTILSPSFSRSPSIEIDPLYKPVNNTVTTRPIKLNVFF